MSDKPRVLILGGVGFVGRNLVSYLAKNNLVSKICVADKVIPSTAGLTAEESKIYESDLVVFKQSNLAREQTIDDVYNVDGGNYDYVINLAATTKYSQDPEIYKENIIGVAKVSAKAAVKHKVKMFIQVSTGQVYESGKSASKEDGKIKPWTGIAKASVEAEKAVRETEGLKYIIVRPAIIYGPGDHIGLTPRLVIGAIYRFTGKKMEMLYSKKLRLNTVHVRDVARALWHLTTKGKEGQVYNLADSNDTDQGKINTFLEQLYGIKTDCKGDFFSNIMATISMKSVVEYCNDLHLKPWSDLCRENGILETPLTPYLDEELLYDRNTAIDGSAITATGFKYEYPAPTLDLLREVLDGFIEKGWFPKGALANK